MSSGMILPLYDEGSVIKSVTAGFFSLRTALKEESEMTFR
jgi:hypothetical protein